MKPFLELFALLVAWAALGPPLTMQASGTSSGQKERGTSDTGHNAYYPGIAQEGLRLSALRS